MKKIFLIIIAFSITNLFGQARLATTDYQKTTQPAVEIEIPFSEKTTSKAIEEKMEKMGFKGDNSKGFMVYKAVRIAQLGPDAYDLYFKTERKSKKEKDVTLVTMMVSTGNDNFAGDSKPALMNNAIAFLDSQLVTVADYDLELQVTDQDKEVKKADKKMNNLTSEAEDLQKKKRKIEKEIEENLKNQDDQKVEMEKQRQLLSTITGRRKQ
ncbi:MAG: hypothetical protein ABIN67_20740 [Ferruginibacter sp.]